MHQKSHLAVLMLANYWLCLKLIKKKEEKNNLMLKKKVCLIKFLVVQNVKIKKGIDGIINFFSFW